MSREAAHLGVDGILGTVPYYNNPPQEGLFQHFRAIARAVDLPVILYNIPARSPRNMEASTTLRLAREVPNIVGVKEASANLKQIGEIIRDAPPGFRVWSGNDADILTIMALGGYGVVSVAAHLVGPQIAELIGCLRRWRHGPGGRDPPSADATGGCAVRHQQPDPAEVRAEQDRHAGGPDAIAARADRPEEPGNHGRCAGEHARRHGRGRPGVGFRAGWERFQRAAPIC